MKTVKEIAAVFREELADMYDVKEIDSLRNIAIAEIAGTLLANTKAFPETELPQKHLDEIGFILNELKTGRPIQYILGYTEFCGLNFKVNPSVLIPRPETEELVEWVLNDWRMAHGTLWKPYRILDIGTGSGCIAISLKKNLPDFSVSAIDISPDALQTAKENAELNQVKINFIQADILDPKLKVRNSKFEIIVSNPPYVTQEDKKQMHTNILDFEPHSAIFAPQTDPLLFYNAIADFALIHLEKNGLLFFEINESYGQEVIDLLAHKSFKDIELKKGIRGRDRMIEAVLA